MARCGSCSYFDGPPQPAEKEEREKLAAQQKAAGVIVRGKCRREPTVQHVTAEDWCGEHPELVAARLRLQAEAFATALAGVAPGGGGKQRS